ncbi:cbb3-type cytochrome c oxidase subunit 3 [Aminobacter sp. BA135]
MDYTTLRHFADSWGLLAMTVFFIGAILFALRPGGKQAAERAAQIPLKED